MKPATKQKLALTGGAIAVCGIAFVLLHTQGDTSNESPMTIGGGGLGGFGDLFRKLLGAGDISGGLAPLPGLGNLPLPPTGQAGVDLSNTYNPPINSTAPDTLTPTNYVSNVFNQSNNSQQAAAPDSPMDTYLGGGVGVNAQILNDLTGSPYPTYTYSSGPIDPYAAPGSHEASGQYVSSIDVGAPLLLGGINMNPPMDAQTYNNLVSNSTVPTNGLEGGYIYGIANS